jgi:surface polysaccharide O-acyltransferase-like enzyme
MILSEPAPAPRNRLAGLDAARVLATFAIVWTHVAEGQGQEHAWTALGRFGTSFYIIVAALFVVRGAERLSPRSFSEELRTRAHRLLRPFLVWSLLYGIYYSVREIPRGTSVEDLTRWWGPVAGTAVHLWFLPFVFFWGLLAAYSTPSLHRIPLRKFAIGGFLVSVAVYWFCYRWLFFALSREWLWKYHLHRLDRWVDEIPPFVTATWGALVFHRSRRRTQQFFERQLIPLAAIGLVGFFLAQFFYAHQIDAIRSSTQTDGRFMGNIAALFLLGAFLAMDGRALVRKLAPLGRFTYLAFLVHMLVVEVLRDPVKHLPGYGTLWFSFLTSIVVFILSLLLSRVIQRSKHLALLRA